MSERSELTNEYTLDPLAAFRLDGRVVLITGSSSGLGAGFARATAAVGAKLVLAARREGRLAELAAELRATGAQVHFVAADVREPLECARIVRSAVETFGVVDVLVNNAGIGTATPASRETPESFRAVVDVCLTGAFIVAKYAGRHLIDGGALVSISSLNARQPAIGMSAYCSSKAGLSMLTQVAALELAPRGIRVNAVAPGFVHTPLTEGAAAVPGVVEEYVENTPLGRAGTPEDIADAVLFLTRAPWLTGEVLDLNGGAHMKRYPDVIGHVNRLMST